MWKYAEKDISWWENSEMYINIIWRTNIRTNYCSGPIYKFICKWCNIGFNFEKENVIVLTLLKAILKIFIKAIQNIIRNICKWIIPCNVKFVFALLKYNE